VPLIAVLGAVLFLLLAGSAGAVGPSPGLTLESQALPSAFSVKDSSNPHCNEASKWQGCDAYRVVVRNAGSVETSGEITLKDAVPAGVTARGVSFIWRGPSAAAAELEGVNLAEEPFAQALKLCPSLQECRFLPFTLQPDETLEMTTYVTVNEPAAPGPLTNTAEVSGGGAASAKSEVTAGSGPPPAFGFSQFDGEATGPGGERDTQAADHPYELTTSIDLNSEFRQGPDGNFAVNGVVDPKTIVVDLPLGFVGSVRAAPRCTFAQLSSHIEHGEGGCPKDTIIGHLFTMPQSTDAINGPIYNMVPEHGVPAEFAYVDTLAGAHVFYTHVVPTPRGYVLQALNPDIPQIKLTSIVATIYGDPALRDQTSNQEIPFFTNPSNCNGEEPTATIYMDSWRDPGKLNEDGTPVNLEEPAWAKMESKSPPMTGCDILHFTPELKAQPTTQRADTPSGLNFEMKLPQTEEPEVPATPTLKNATVTFPEGMTVDPSAGGGLEACSTGQIGWQGGSPFNFNREQPACPEASKIGELELETPLIAGKLVGQMYLAAQNENPFGSIVATYVVVNDPTTGVVLKLAGEVKADPGTGRLTGYFPEDPNLPFSDLKLHFFGGPRAEFATPPSCGTFTVGSDLEPWSAPDSGLPATPFDSFTIDEGCAVGFAPAFTAGSTNLQAGAYTSFVASFSRADSDQELGGLTLTLPPGLLANVGSVPQCTEAQIREAETGTGGCPESTRVGTVTAFAGPGPNPLFVAGKAYWTGPYKGAPFGLAVVVPAVAGPFHLGTVVVRQALYIDPLTAQATDVSDPFPTILDPVGANGQTSGIPIKLRRVDVAIDRPNFTFNPTNCEHLQVGGAVTSTGGLSSSLATPFQVTNCATLKFQPQISVATAGKTSKANGAGLRFLISYPKGTQQGVQSWFNEAKFDLPKQLPARLTTIQKACLAATFETNRGACPAASEIGHAIVHTPVLPVPLEGPVYFVSYGGAKFPDAVLALKGDGVTVDLHGETFINGKTGVTSATFRNTPDTPFESIEVSIPTGPFSEFGANLPASAHGSFCGQNLKMPTLFKASNGLQINEQVPIAVTGCAKPKTRAQLYAAALRACRHKHNRRNRQTCERLARTQYGHLAKSKNGRK